LNIPDVEQEEIWVVAPRRNNARTVVPVAVCVIEKLVVQPRPGREVNSIHNEFEEYRSVRQKLHDWTVKDDFDWTGRSPHNATLHLMNGYPI
jgi:hypothetical protein